MTDGLLCDLTHLSPYFLRRSVSPNDDFAGPSLAFERYERHTGRRLVLVGQNRDADCHPAQVEIDETEQFSLRQIQHAAVIGNVGTAEVLVNHGAREQLSRDLTVPIRAVRFKDRVSGEKSGKNQRNR